MNRQAGSMFRIIVGGYLVYLGISLVSAVVKEKPENMVLMAIFGVVFIVFGGGYALFTLKRMFDESKREREAAAEEEAAGEEPEEPEEEIQSGPKSLTERARMLAGSSEEDTEEGIETDYEEK